MCGLGMRLSRGGHTCLLGFIHQVDAVQGNALTQGLIQVEQAVLAVCWNVGVVHVVVVGDDL